MPCIMDRSAYATSQPSQPGHYSGFCHCRLHRRGGCSCRKRREKLLPSNRSHVFMHKDQLRRDAEREWIISASTYQTPLRNQREESHVFFSAKTEGKKRIFILFHSLTQEEKERERDLNTRQSPIFTQDPLPTEVQRARGWKGDQPIRIASCSSELSRNRQCVF